MYFLALLLLGACAVPVIYFSRHGQGALLAIFAVEFAAYYPIPVLLLHRVQTGDFPTHDLPSYLVCEALALSLASFLCICLGYCLVPSRSPLIPRFKFTWSNPGVIRMAAAGMCAVGLTANLLLFVRHNTGGVNQYVALSSNLLMFGIALLFTLQLMHRLNPLWIAALWGIFVPSRFLIGITAGATGAALSVGVVLLVLYSELRGRMWWSAMVIGFVAVVALRPLMTPFRSLTWHHGAEAGATGLQRLSTFGHIATRAAEGRFGDYDHLEQFAAKRLCVICTFSDVILQTPTIVPYWDGASFLPILYKPIPRLIWPDKPSDDSGQDFGHRYGYLALTDMTTSYNLPQTVEMYANFGTAGVVIISFLFGLLYRFVELTFFHERSGVGAVAMGAVVLSELVVLESGTSLVMGGYILIMIMIFPVALVVNAADMWSESRHSLSAS